MYKNMGKVKRTLEEYAILTVATLILVVGVYVFKFPNNFSFGGVTGIAVVLSAVMPATPGNITFIINMALLVVGFIFLGKSFGIRTVYVSVLMSVGLSLAEVWFPMEHPLTTQPVLELMYAIVLPKSIFVDRTMDQMRLCKYFTIICNDPEPICDFITNELHRSATIYKAEGAYEHNQKTIIITIMKRSQAVELRNYIRIHQPTAFIAITNSSEIIGKGFRGFN